MTLEQWPHQDTQPEWWTPGPGPAQPHLGPYQGQRLQVWEQQHWMGLALLLARLLWSLNSNRLLSLLWLSLELELGLGLLLRVCLQLVLAQAQL